MSMSVGSSGAKLGELMQVKVKVAGWRAHAIDCTRSGLGAANANMIPLVALLAYLPKQSESKEYLPGLMSSSSR